MTSTTIPATSTVQNLEARIYNISPPVRSCLIVKGDLICGLINAQLLGQAHSTSVTLWKVGFSCGKLFVQPCKALKCHMSTAG